MTNKGLWMTAQKYTKVWISERLVRKTPANYKKLRQEKTSVLIVLTIITLKVCLTHPMTNLLIQKNDTSISRILMILFSNFRRNLRWEEFINCCKYLILMLNALFVPFLLNTEMTSTPKLNRQWAWTISGKKLHLKDCKNHSFYSRYGTVKEESSGKKDFTNPL